MTAFDRVMARPASLAARYALLDEWKRTNHPQTELLEKQLAYRLFTGTSRRGGEALALERDITQLINEHGRAWAGRVAELATRFRFHRGLVTEVYVRGDRFLEVMPELLALQPIQDVVVIAPWGPLDAIVRSPLLAKLSALTISGAEEAFGDGLASVLASSPHVANLVYLALAHDAIGRAGAEALVASPYLATAKYVTLVGNPYDPTPRVIDEGDGYYSPYRPPEAAELEAVHGTRPWLAEPTGFLEAWPREHDELALIEDHVADASLARLEQLAIEVDRLEAGDEAQQITAGAKRQRLLIELDVYGLLTGQPDVGTRVAGYPTLFGYHEACVQMASYHASAARIRLVGNAIPLKPTDGLVSLDWFRTPTNYLPANVSAHDWLALCERNFTEPMPTTTGERFARLEGKIHVLAYRIEATREPKLWRALPA